MYTKLISVTDYCTGNCNFCPFDGTRQHQSFEYLQNEVQCSADPIVLLSGGEPLEWPSFNKIIEVVQAHPDKAFRVATGGHVSFNNIKKDLLKLASQNNFSGISVGTDIILSSRNHNAENYIFSWKQNVDFLIQNNISFSITLTMAEDLISNLGNILEFLNSYSPAFYLIRSVGRDLLNETIERKILEEIDKKINGIIRYELD